MLEKNETSSYSIVSDSLGPHGLYGPWSSPGQNTGVSSCSLLQGSCNPGIERGLPHCRQILYQLSHKGSPRILERVSLSLFQGIFPIQKSNQDLLHYRFFTNWAIREAMYENTSFFFLKQAGRTYWVQWTGLSIKNYDQDVYMERYFTIYSII